MSAAGMVQRVATCAPDFLSLAQAVQNVRTDTEWAVVFEAIEMEACYGDLTNEQASELGDRLLRLGRRQGWFSAEELSWWDGGKEL
jgi:hypothetical protein